MAGTSKIRSIFVTTTASEDETSEGNPGNRKGDAVDVTPSVAAPEDEACSSGTNNGGTNNGGTSNGGTNNDGTSNGGTNNDGINNGGTSTTWTGTSGVRPDARQPDGCRFVERQARQGPQMRYCLWAPECVETPLATPVGVRYVERVV